MNSTLTLVGMLTGEKAVRREHQQDVPDSDGSKPFIFISWEAFMSELLEAQGKEHNEAVPDSIVIDNKKVANVRKASWAYVKDYTRKHTEAHGDIASYLVKYLSDPPKKRRKRKGVERSPEVEPEVERPSAKAAQQSISY